MLEEHSHVALTKPLPNLGLEPGAVGVVVHIHGQGSAYEVEFLTMDGHTIGVETVAASGLRQAMASVAADTLSTQAPPLG